MKKKMKKVRQVDANGWKKRKKEKTLGIRSGSGVINSKCLLKSSMLEYSSARVDRSSKAHTLLEDRASRGIARQLISKKKKKKKTAHQIFASINPRDIMD